MGQGGSLSNKRVAYRTHVGNLWGTVMVGYPEETKYYSYKHFSGRSHSSLGAFMDNPTTERWKDLCSQASAEQDPDKLIALVQEVNNILEEKERQLGIARR